MNKATEQLFEMIKKWLRQRKTTQTSLAHALGIKQPSLSGMLSGKTKLPKRRLQEIIKILKPDDSDINRAFFLYCTSEQDLDTPYSENEDIVKSIKMSDEVISKSNKLKLNLSDQNTYRLLEYWRDLSDSKRYEVLSILAHIKEKGELPGSTKNSFYERNLDLFDSEVNKGERK